MGCWLLLIEPVHCGSNSILKVRSFGTPCMIDYVNFAVVVKFVLGDVVLQRCKAGRKWVYRER